MLNANIYYSEIVYCCSKYFVFEKKFLLFRCIQVVRQISFPLVSWKTKNSTLYTVAWCRVMRLNKWQRQRTTSFLLWSRARTHSMTIIVLCWHYRKFKFLKLTFPFFTIFCWNHHTIARTMYYILIHNTLLIYCRFDKKEKKFNNSPSHRYNHIPKVWLLLAHLNVGLRDRLLVCKKNSNVPTFSIHPLLYFVVIFHQVYINQGKIIEEKYSAWVTITKERVGKWVLQLIYRHQFLRKNEPCVYTHFY